MLHAVKRLCKEAAKPIPRLPSSPAHQTGCRYGPQTQKSIQFSKWWSSEHTQDERPFCGSSLNAPSIETCYDMSFRSLKEAYNARGVQNRRRADSTCKSQTHFYTSREYPFEANFLDTSLIDLDLTNAFKLEREYRNRVRRWEELLGPNDVKTLQAIMILAYCYAVGGNYEPAKCLYKRLVLASVFVYGQEHAVTLCMLRNLSALLQLRGDYYEAAAILTRVLGSCEKSSKSDLKETSEPVRADAYPDTIEVQQALAISYDSLGRFREAEQLYRKVLGQQTKLFDKGDPQLLETARCLDLNLRMQRKAPPKIQTYDEVFFRKANTFPKAKKSRTLPFPDLSLCQFGDQKCFTGTEKAKRQQRSQVYWASTGKRTYSV